MSAYNRIPLSSDEVPRFKTLNIKILEALGGGPKCNSDLSKIALDYGRRIRDLREQGHRIERKRLGGGINQYTLRSDIEPQWAVDVWVRLADGSQSVQHIIVKGDNEGLVRNRAQHLAHRVKILSSRRLP